jgi:transcription elongation factor GreA
VTPLSTEASATFDALLGPQGESIADADRLAELSGALDAALARGEAAALTDHLKSLTPGTGLHAGRVYVEARLALARQDLVTADQAFQPLCEKLNQASAWPVLARVASEWALGAGTHAAARYVMRCWRQGGTAVVPEPMLRAAHEVFPNDPDLIWALATTLDEQGSSRESRRLLATALKPLAEEKDAARVEEGVLRLLEAPEASILLMALEAVELLAHRGEAKKAAALLESLRDPAIAHGLAEPGWALARRAIEKHPAESGFRPTAVAFLRAAHADIAALDRVIEVTGIDRIAVPPATALKALDLVLPFSPGYYVEHSGWGLGPIKDNDGEFLVIDFPAKPGHRMNLAAAAKVLKSLPADDLKVLLTVDKARLLHLKENDPAGLVLIALKRTGGQASATELRKVLVPGVLATGEWSGWWKKSREKLMSDPRLDSRQAFNDVYRIPVPGEDIEETFILPPFDEPKGIGYNVGLIYDFIEHHPAQEERLKAECFDRVQKWAERRTAKPHERARARLLLLRWDEARRAGHEEVVRIHFREGMDLSAAGSPTEQAALFAIGLAGDTKPAALAVGLNARNQAMREVALKALFADPGPEPVKFLAGLFADPVEYTDALFATADAVGARPEGDPRLDDLLWPVMLGLIDLLNVTGREPVRKRGLKLIDAGGGLLKRVRVLPPDERTESQLMARLRDWRQSDRVLFPILEAFSDAGLESVVESVRQKRKAAHEKLFAGAPAADDITAGPVIMSRATFDKLHAELQQINMDLKTVIPEAIKKARELGDLRENAEYEAAKLKQANASKRLAQLDGLLERVRILDDLALEEGKAGPGTEVDVRDPANGESSTHWILGEGDGDHGPHVISYRAPLGIALSGAKVGDVVDYTPPGEPARKLEVTSIRIRKP